MARSRGRAGVRKAPRAADAPTPGAPGAAADAAADAAHAPRTLAPIHVLAALAILLCAVLAYVSRLALNPDGVSYLDLAAALRRGDIAHFVQGYWSPLYPVILAAAGALSGREGGALVPVVHLVNLLVAAAGILILWNHARRRGDVSLGRMTLAAFLLCGARPPRVDAVTPDLLLQVVLLAATYELLRGGGFRWPRLGLLLGAAFLTKTSAWPWLLVVFAVLLWSARHDRAYRAVGLAAATCLGVMLLWIAPLSLEAGRPTLGSAGRLNYCWYLEDCEDSRTPDTHLGQHTEYRAVSLDDGRRITMAAFPDTAWTYAPWSDPTAWDAGVLTRSRRDAGAAELVVYWATISRYVFGWWLLPLFLGVLLPAVVIARRAGPRRTEPPDRRAPAVVSLLGLVGIFQFIAVHAEPRLIAPFALMFAVGALEWLRAGSAEEARARGRGGTPPAAGISELARAVASYAGLVVAIPFALASIRDGAATSERTAIRGGQIVRIAQALGEGGVSMRRIAIVGPALPFVQDVRRVDGRVVAQVLPSSAATLATLPPAEQDRFVRRVFGGQADVAWFTRDDGTFRVTPIRTP